MAILVLAVDARDAVHLVVVPALDYQAQPRSLAVVDLNLHERGHADDVHVLRRKVAARDGHGFDGLVHSARANSLQLSVALLADEPGDCPSNGSWFGLSGYFQDVHDIACWGTRPAPPNPLFSFPLLGELDCSGFSQHHDLDLARIGEVLLYLFNDIARQPRGGKIVHLVRLDDDAHFASGLDGE